MPRMHCNSALGEMAGMAFRFLGKSGTIPICRRGPVC